MGGGKFMGWLNSNPAIMEGVKGAVGGALNSLKPKEQMSVKMGSAPEVHDPADKPKMEGSMMYLAIGAIVLFMLMKKK